MKITLFWSLEFWQNTNYKPFTGENKTKWRRRTVEISYFWEINACERLYITLSFYKHLLTIELQRTLTRAFTLERKKPNTAVVSHFSHQKVKKIGWNSSMTRVDVWWRERRICMRRKRSKVRTVGRPTGCLRAYGGAPLRASPHPWCRPGRSHRLRPVLSHSCDRTDVK